MMSFCFSTGTRSNLGPSVDVAYGVTFLLRKCTSVPVDSLSKLLTPFAEFLVIVSIAKSKTHVYQPNKFAQLALRGHVSI
jgi:hypothetical protein